ncbi:MAG: alpha/beta fold hydrolase [Polaromonas sp.]|nr:alpha/beta fold hydrolase [Polaromonas sp.]
MPAQITKHFVTVGSRRLHYHRAGVGPVLVLLHASACSAKVMRSHIDELSESFTVIAPDTPGFGLSDLLPLEQVTTEDLADALADTLDALGIEQVSVYGRHTGAQIAVEFAARHPARCAMALTDGFPVYTIEERIKRLAGYLPAIVPEFDGSHLLWIWFRYREQHVFWPWNAQDLAHRADTDVPDLDFLHRGVIELLEAGDGYRIGYATAYRHRGLDVVADLTVPVCFGGRPGDSQGHTPDMMPAGTWTQQLPRDKHEALRVEHQLLRQYPANGTAPQAPVCSAVNGRSTTDYLDMDGRMVLVRSIGDLHAAPPVLIIHQLPGSSALYDPLVCAIGKSCPVLALDLPGHGESDALADATQSVDAWLNSVLSVLDRLGISTCHVYGHNGGATVAVELARRHPSRVVSLLLDAPVCLAPNEQDSIGAGWLQGVEPVTPSWDGSHLLRVWHMRRDMALWWPWFDKKRDSARTVKPRIDPAELTLEVREIMKQPVSFAPAWRSVMGYPMATRLAQTTQPCLLMCAKTDVFEPCLQQAAAARPGLLPLWLDDDCAARAQAMVEFMGQLE